MKNRRLIDVQTIFHKMEQRNLSAAVKFYCGKEMVHAHSAEADIKATYEVFQAQLEKYTDLQKDINFLHTFSSHTNNADLSGKIVYNEQHEEIFNFGKHKGKLVDEIFKKEPSYYDWMMKGEFPLHTKKVITAIRLRAFNQKK
jgi:DNA polymerase-3 subunit epsilon